jgi:hypothetical protein
MDWIFSSEGKELLVWLLLLLGIALGLAFLLMLWVLWQVRQIKLPPNADFLTTLRATPLVVVVMLDLLDLSLDFLSAPIAWVVLSRLGLQGLRGVTVVESLIPGTQLIPTMTLAWIIARLAGPRFKF